MVRGRNCLLLFAELRAFLREAPMEINEELVHLRRPQDHLVECGREHGVSLIALRSHDRAALSEPWGSGTYLLSRVITRLYEGKPPDHIVFLETSRGVKAISALSKT